MTPQQKLKHLILLENARMTDGGLPEISVENIDQIFLETEELQDAKSSVRGGHFKTNIDPEWVFRISNNYESDSVAAKYIDGSYIGWTYWHGGGKHSDPEAIDWIEHAYDLKCTEEEKMTVIRTFEKA